MNNYQLFMPYVKQVSKWYLIGFIGSVFRFLIPLFVPLILKYIFDQLLQNEALSRAEMLEQLLYISAGMIIVFLFLRTPMEYVRQFCIHKANNNIIKQLRKDAFQKVHSLDAKYFVDNKSGEIGTRFFDDIEKVRGFLTAMFGNIWIEMIVLLFVITVMVTLNVKLAVLSVLLVGFQFVLAHLLSKKLKRTTRNMMKYRSVMSGFIFEKIQGAFLSKLFAAEKRDKEELDEHLIHFDGLTDKHARVNAVMLASVNVLSDMTPFIVAIVASLYVIDGSLTIGSLIAFFAYVDKMRSPVAALVNAYPSIVEGNVALNRIFDFFLTPSTIIESEKPVELKQFHQSIQLNNVSFAYDGKNEIIKNMSLTLEKGKTYAFVGESGGGKSTILQLLLRMYDATKGDVLIDGVNIKDYSIASLREHMGIVTQDNFLYSTSIKDNIKMARLDATDDEIIAAAKKAFAHDFISELPQEYDTEIGERGIRLSGGQKQRIALARVFLKNPSLIILDEATSALDNESEKLVQESINQFEKDKTIIMIAHRLSTIVNADTIFVVKKGEIVENGNHQSLLRRNGYYKELYSKQNLLNGDGLTQAG
ncbi:ABC transporter ATP-binding protein [Lederbergia wuyishanensis]|uniref:Subfamily B ATP-binding cassette protein MsbA n=1 Tax=Lederbergia wuyishanensis TaxID=1347903 RepID=A0ABU0D841_9BACI|nr:ABC transporter ATP-binding protein [Lederbergia wuyishanensis]MCJ8009335.1 ABC transporter ATP-binding protein/permease [Lederbergia wuyishanensis]MDQ0344530.1 subfamily B ATP-binding cassette protein MsbA [Lederbergia wuyishanensis]